MNAPALSIYVVSLVCVWAILYIRWRLGLFTARLLVGRVRLCRVRENGDPKGIDSSGLGLKRQEVCVILISSSSTFKTFHGDGLTALYIKKSLYNNGKRRWLHTESYMCVG